MLSRDNLRGQGEITITTATTKKEGVVCEGNKMKKKRRQKRQFQNGPKRTDLSSLVGVIPQVWPGLKECAVCPSGMWFYECPNIKTVVGFGFWFQWWLERSLLGVIPQSLEGFLCHFLCSFPDWKNTSACWSLIGIQWMAWILSVQFDIFTVIHP